MNTDLVSLAADINREHDAAMELARSAVQRARHAGEFLLKAKELCAHGTWLPWLQENCPDISELTAQGYMRLARFSDVTCAWIYCMAHDSQKIVQNEVLLDAQPAGNA